jgi:hypothetical protein
MKYEAAWRDIRRLRAEPPGLAGEDKGRRRVFAAALQQAEELHQASAGCGYPSRPLPLFYALSQGGRAIAAARTPSSGWQLSAHGLTVKFENEDPLATRVSPEAAGAFQTVCSATGSPALAGSLTLNELLATLPEVSDSILLPGSEPRAVKLELEYESSLGEYHMLVPPFASMAVYCGPEASLPGERHLPAMEELLRSHRRADGWAIVPNVRSSAGRPCIALTWQFDDGEGGRGYKTLDTVSTRMGDCYYLRPTLGRDDGEVSLLMTWWSVLLALSSLARYEPARWQRALDIDRPGAGAALEEILDTAQERVPELLFDALTEELPMAGRAC